MAVPANVLEQEQAADRAIEEAQRRKDVANNPSPPEQSVDQNLSPSVEGTPEVQVNEPPVVAPVAEPVADPVHPEPSTEPSLQDQLAREVQLRKTLEGRLRSQLKPANEEIRRLKGQLEETQTVIEQMQKEGKASGAERYLSDEERDELGDVLDINTRMVQGILEERLGAENIEDIVSAIMNKNQQSAEASGPSDDFWPIVDQLRPGSRELNRTGDDRWLEFLGLHNQFTGRLNRDEAQEAIENDDPSALADIFAEFMRQYGIVQTEASAPAPTNQPVPRPEKAGGAKQVAPAKAAEVPVWTQPEVNAFYTDVSKGKFKGREAEADKLEAEIMAAASAGRIR